MSKEKISVQITSTNFTYGAKVYGKGGTYPVDEKTARYIVKSGKGIVVEGTLPDEEDQELAAINDKQFLSMIRRNAVEIVDIIEQEMKKAKEAPVQMQADLTIIPPDNSEGGAKNDDSANSGNDESEPTINASDDDAGIPEDFPGRDVLIAAGITKVADIPTAKDDLMKVEGMTARLANQIGVKLGQG